MVNGVTGLPGRRAASPVGWGQDLDTGSVTTRGRRMEAPRVQWVNPPHYSPAPTPVQVSWTDSN